MRNNRKKNNITTVSFFSTKTKLIDGEVQSLDGGFYLEKTSSKRKLCYKKANLCLTMELTRKTFQQLKRLTSGVILERADVYCNNDLNLYGGDDRDDVMIRRAAHYPTNVYTSPKEPAPFVIQHFKPR